MLAAEGKFTVCGCILLEFPGQDSKNLEFEFYPEDLIKSWSKNSNFLSQMFFLYLIRALENFVGRLFKL